MSAEDQEGVLTQVKSEYEKLQSAFHNAREEHAFLRRQGRDGGESEFDEGKIIEGEVYKLNMKLDELEQHVGENTKVKNIRQPFSGPMKASHSMNLAGMAMSNAAAENEKKKDPAAPLAPNRPPSVGSIAGGPGDIDTKLHQLSKEYNSLMDRYRQLKQLKRTPDRDNEIEGLLGVRN